MPEDQFTLPDVDNQLLMLVNCILERSFNRYPVLTTVIFHRNIFSIWFFMILLVQKVRKSVPRFLWCNKKLLTFITFLTRNRRVRCSKIKCSLRRFMNILLWWYNHNIHQANNDVVVIQWYNVRLFSSYKPDIIYFCIVLMFTLSTFSVFDLK